MTTAMLISQAVKQWKFVLITLLIVALTISVNRCISNSEQITKVTNKYEQQITSEQIIIADAASTRDAVASLSNTLDAVSTRAATDADFQRNALRVTSDSLKKCSGEYSKVAESLDRFANSLRAVQQANKR